MSASVSLYIRIRTANGQNPYVKPVYGKNKRLKPQYALINGKPEKHAEGVYYLRFVRNGKRVWEAVGAEPAQALAKLSQREKIQEAIAAGANVVEPKTKKPHAHPRSSLARAKDEYLGDIAKYRAPATYDAYRLSLETFFKGCGKEEASQVERRDILDFVDAMDEEGLERRTQFNRVRNVLTFFRRQGVQKIIDRHDMPSYTEKLVAVYEKSELDTLFAACTPDEYATFHFFLGSGCRDNEVVHSFWEDLNFHARTYSVKAKPDYGFTPKNHEEREIPLSDLLIDILRDYRKRHPKARLMFPRDDGEPNQHLLRILKGVALRAGLNCGRCRCKNGQTCIDNPACEKWQLHSFRRTFATTHSDSGIKIEQISKWCGHASIETTKRYLATTASRSVEVRRWVNNSFAGFALQGRDVPSDGVGAVVLLAQGGTAEQKAANGTQYVMSFAD